MFTKKRIMCNTRYITPVIVDRFYGLKTLSNGVDKINSHNHAIDIAFSYETVGKCYFQAFFKIAVFYSTGAWLWMRMVEMEGNGI